MGSSNSATALGPIVMDVCSSCLSERRYRDLKRTQNQERKWTAKVADIRKNDVNQTTSKIPDLSTYVRTIPRCKFIRANQIFVFHFF